MRPLAAAACLAGLVAALACGRGGAGKEEDPPAAARPYGPVLLELARGRDPGEILRLRAAGGELGPGGGTLSFRFFSTPEQADDLWYLRRTYAPFELRWPGGRLSFQGKGAAPAGPVERRAVAEWARAVAAEMAGEGSERSFGLVFAWHGGGVPCEDVSVSLAGTVWAEPCPWGGPVRARLDPAQLPRLFAWFDTLAPFQETPGDESGDPDQTSRLIFVGRGKRAATPAERREIEAFGHALAQELQVRRPLPANVAPPRGAVATVLLLPADLARGGRPTDIVLTPPAEPPAPPVRVAPPTGPEGGGEEPAAEAPAPPG